MNFDVSRLRRADQIIGIGAIAFFIFLFLFKWFGGSASSNGVSFSTSFNGWHTFHDLRWIWLITIIVALVAVAVRAGVLTFKTPVQLSVAVATLGALSTLTILYRIIHHPSGAENVNVPGFHISASYGIKIGIWLGLIAAAAVTYGAYLAMQEEGTSLADVRDQASGAFSNLSAQAGGGSSGRSTPASTAATPSSTPVPPTTSAPPPQAPPIPPTSTPPPVAPAEQAAPPIPPPGGEPPAS